jgi:hypothetical protein
MMGLKLIDSSGRAEVEVAHIRPVGANVQNGLALSGSFDTPPAAAAQDERVLMRSTAD